MNAESGKDTTTQYTHCLKIREKWSEEEQLLVVIDTETDAIIHLNTLGVSIWKATRTRACFEDILDCCRAALPDTPEEILERDVRKLLQQLLDRDILLQHEIVFPG